jgi:hypothetical protein
MAVLQSLVLSPGSSTSCIDGCHCLHHPFFSAWKIFFIAPLPQLGLYPLHCLIPLPHFHDGWGFFDFVMLITVLRKKKRCPLFVGLSGLSGAAGWGRTDSLDT